MSLRRVVDVRAHLKATPVRLVHLVWPVHFEREVLESHLVVPVLAAVRGPEPHPLVAEAEIDDLLGAAIAQIPHLFLEPERPEQIE
jgi:hypothetical protein